MAFAIDTESMVEALSAHLSRTLSHRIVRSHSTSKLQGLWLTLSLTQLTLALVSGPIPRADCQQRTCLFSTLHETWSRIPSSSPCPLSDAAAECSVSLFTSSSVPDQCNPNTTVAAV
jgi:hypothetical protein